jgi:hypothetical protein
MNTSQEELFGTMATLTGVTGNTAEVSTQLASVYSAFLKPSEKMTAAAKKNGFATASQMMKTLGFRKSLIALNKEAKGNEAVLAKMFGRKEALVGALALLGGQSDEYTRKLGEMEKAIGSTDEAYRLQTEGINEQGHEWEKTKRRMEDFAITIGDKLLPVLDRLLDAIEPLLTGLEQMDEDDLNLTLSILGVTAVIGPLITAVKGLYGALLFLATNPVIATIVGIGVAVVLVAKYFDQLTASVEWFITSLEQVYLWLKKIFVGQHVSLLGKLFGVDLTGAGLTSEEIDKDLASAAERKSRIDFRDKDEIARDQERRKSMQRTAANISKYGAGGGPGFSDEFSMQSLAGAGGGGGGTTIGGTTVNFNGQVMDVEKAMRQAERAAKRADRERAKTFNSAANNSGPMEQ